MTTEAFVRLADDGTGKKIRNVSFTGLGGDPDARHLQVVVCGDPEVAATLARILSADPALTDPALVARTIERAAGSIGHGQQAVTATAVALPNLPCRRLHLRALLANAIPVVVGGAGVTTADGYPLEPGDGDTYYVANANLLFLVAASTGAAVAFLWEN